MDFETGINKPEAQRALENLKKSASFIKVLGSYEKGKFIES
jgi:prephenate dehydratase